MYNPAYKPPERPANGLLNRMQPGRRTPSFHTSHLKNSFPIMGNLLYIIAVILIIIWLLGFLGFESFGMGNLIHVLLVIAIIAVVLRLIRGSRI